MCGRYRLTAVDRIRERLGLEDSEVELRPRYNIAPSQPVPIVRQFDGLRILSMARWGLVPHWAKDVSIGYKMINARSETAIQKPAFKQSFARRRCLIPADSFYEWKKDGKVKHAFNIGMKDDSVFAFAGLWDSWETPENLPLESCTILTTKANSLVSVLHDRMPVIVPSEHYEAWLNAPASEASSLLLPFDPALMKQYEVSSFVNNPKNDSSECIVPVVA